MIPKNLKDQSFPWSEFWLWMLGERSDRPEVFSSGNESVFLEKLRRLSYIASL